ncbi:MAG: methyltransferase domain-containing protein [Rhodospirillales bacterium]|nr:methyltransferase domain-containing protein [Rhodospirillales bacterium]MCY4005078.1 methyltransferase domain-containing protein [Rhodospirillales bacterium]MYE18536.1 methyltransferase domain-containing protein [Rhodospirillales bacterium]
MANPDLASFQFGFDENDQVFTLSGSMRPKEIREISACLESLRACAMRATGMFYVNVRRLLQSNNVAFNGMASVLLEVCRERSDVNITITMSSVVGWTPRKFRALQRKLPRINVVEYDKDFYPGQAFVEDSSFVSVLRRQTTMTWRHEKHILPRHGIGEGMKIADICCGIGDFAILLFKEFNPTYVVALDHAKSSLEYARKMAKEFDVTGVEYVYGDAAEMLLPNGEFDFVTCRHSLQVFDQPERILSELLRICKPGGRVYVTNEKNSHCLGEPRSESIQWTYNEVAKLWKHFNMDIEIGPKSRRLLLDAGFVDIRMESFMVTNLDGDPEEFAEVVRTWRHMFAESMARERGDNEAFIEKFKKGFDDHIFAALHPKGYAGWPIWVASGRKPL